MQLELSRAQILNKMTDANTLSTKWTTIGNVNSSNSPQARYNHISFFYKGFMYIHGGTTFLTNEIDDGHQIIYRYNLAQSIWQKQIINNINKVRFDNLNSHCGVVMIQTGELVIYGGSNNRGQCNNDLWVLNLQNLKLIKLQQKAHNKHQIPSPRKSASMILYRQKYLVLYGGINSDMNQFYNDFNIFSWESKKWFNCSGNYQYIINCRYKSSMCLLKDKIYIFGGQYITTDQKSHFLNDFYQIEIKIKNEFNKQKSTTNSVAPTIIFNKIVTNQTPKERGGHSLVPIGQQYLVLFGGQSHRNNNKNLFIDPENKVYVLGDIFIYSILQRKWVQLDINQPIFKFRTLFGICKLDQQQVCISFGLRADNEIQADIITANFNISQISSKFQSSKSNYTNHCLLCEELKINKLQWPFKIQAKFVNQIVEFIQLPFNAFGMLIDNAHMLGATIFNISYEQKTLNKISFGEMESLQNNQASSRVQKYFRFQDNGKCLASQQLQNSLVNFEAGINFNPQGIDKKMKYIIGKQNTKRQFGVNLKLGALKLSQTFLYINILSPEQVRITLFQKQPIVLQKTEMIDQKQQNQTSYQYVCYYYCYNPETDKILHDYSSDLKNAVQEKYLVYIQEAIEKKNLKNVLYLFDLRKFEQQKMFYVDVRLDDIIFGLEKPIFQLEKLGINIYDACDVSLRSYISCLYLKNEVMKITLSVCGGEKKQIPTQMFLTKIDKMLQHKQILDLTQSVENDCKILELYFNPDLCKYLSKLARKVNSFHNGVLLYHKNRLITRFDKKLGQTIKHCQRKILKNSRQIFNIYNMFGYIELPDVVPVNIYKTDFIYNIMMERLYSRLKYVMNYTMRKKKLSGISEFKKFEKKPRDQSGSDKSKQSNKPKKVQKKQVQLSTKQTSKIIQLHQSQQSSNKNKQVQKQKQASKNQKQVRIQQNIIQSSEVCNIIKEPAIGLIQQETLKKVIKKKLASEIDQVNNMKRRQKLEINQQSIQNLSAQKKQKNVQQHSKKQLNLRARPEKQDASQNK